MQNVNDRERRSPESGFTLVEALIAMVILAFGLIAVTNLLVVAATSNAVANRSTMATAAAVAEMERLKAVSLPLLPPPGGNLDFVGLAPSAYARRILPPVPPVPGSADIQVTWTITALPAPFAASRFIVVRAEERSSIGRERTRAEFTTFRQ